MTSLKDSAFFHFLFEVIVQMVFSTKAAGPEAPSFWGKSEDQFGGPKPFGDEGTFQECRKSWQLKIWLFSETRFGETGSQKIAHHFPSHFCLVKTPSIAIPFFLFHGQGLEGLYESDQRFLGRSRICYRAQWRGLGRLTLLFAMVPYRSWNLASIL